MRTKLKKVQIVARLIFATIFFVLIIVGAAIRSEAVAYRGLEIEYLKPTQLNISSTGINRLNFGDERITKIIGDNSQYSVVLTDNGSDLFLTSKIAAGSVIDLTVMTARSEAIDLRLYVKDKEDGAIIKVDLTQGKVFKQNERLEIQQMIEAMKSNKGGKYFVEEGRRVIKLGNEAKTTLNQYVSYRYGDLMGAGFVCKMKKGGKLEREDIRGLFKDILAMFIDNGRGDMRVFVVFKAKEAMDV